MSLNFNKLIKPVPKTAFFTLEDEYVWCGTMAKTNDGIYHLIFSKWPKKLGFSAWVSHSEIGHATSDNPLGPFTYQGTIFKGTGTGTWDSDSVHNPVIMKYEGKYYLYYMGNYGNGEWWDYRNHQRIGVAVADHPAGPYTRFDKPLVDVTPGSWDAHVTNNHTLAIDKKGNIIMMYKGVGEGEAPRMGSVVCGIAKAKHPLGPFEKVAGPIMVNPENSWSVEDPGMWYQDDRFYAVVKDYQGYFTKAGEGTTAFFESFDGIDWNVSKEHPLAFKREITLEDGTVQTFSNLERPQIWMENGKPKVMLCAAKYNLNDTNTYNIQIPLSED